MTPPPLVGGASENSAGLHLRPPRPSLIHRPAARSRAVGSSGARPRVRRCGADEAEWALDRPVDVAVSAAHDLARRVYDPTVFGRRGAPGAGRAILDTGPGVGSGSATWCEDQLTGEVLACVGRSRAASPAPWPPPHPTRGLHRGTRASADELVSGGSRDRYRAAT